MKSPIVRIVFLIASLSPAAPAVYLHFQALWETDHYRFFPFVLLGFIVLLLRLPSPSDRPSVAAGIGSLVLVALGLSLVAASGLVDYTKAGMAGALLSFLGAALLCWDRAGVRRLLPAWLYLWILIPLPFGWDDMLLRELQQMTSAAASAVLDQLGVYHIMTGNIVETGAQRFEIESACSGVRSLFTILAAALFLLLWFRTSIAFGLVIVLIATGWTIAANIARVVLATVIPLRYGIDVSSGLRHDGLGVGAFVVAVTLIYSSFHLLSQLVTHGVHREEESDDSHGDDHSDSGGRRTTFWRSIVGLELAIFAGASIASFQFFAPFLQPRRSAEEILNARLEAIMESTLPETVGDWRRIRFARTTRTAQSIYGKHSATWQFVDEQRPAALSIDYPWKMWHDLHVCYSGGGWEIVDQSVLPQNQTKGDSPVNRLRLRRGDRLGVVFFHLYSLDGRPFVHEELDGGVYGVWLKRARNRLASLDRRGSEPPIHYQVQAFAEFYGEQFRDDVEANLLQLFWTGRDRALDVLRTEP